MKICKNLVVTVLAIMMAVVSAVTASAAAATPEKSTEGMSLEERINKLELTPQLNPNLEAIKDWYDFARVEKIRSDNTLSSYEKMKAVYMDIAEQTKGFSCTSHASLLGTAYEMLGFKVYGASGGVTTKDGKTPASYDGRMGFVKEGYTSHSWIAVEIDGVSTVTSHKETGTINGKPFEYEVLKIDGTDISVGYDAQINGEILFFDVNLHSTHGMDFDSCFAVPPKDTTLYTAVGVGYYF